MAGGDDDDELLDMRAETTAFRGLWRGEKKGVMGLGLRAKGEVEEGLR